MHTYDKANQLVSSTTNGKVTEYAYDAAGRMIQAGDKKYIYNGNNKVSDTQKKINTTIDSLLRTNGGWGKQPVDFGKCTE